MLPMFHSVWRDRRKLAMQIPTHCTSALSTSMALMAATSSAGREVTSATPSHQPACSMAGALYHPSLACSTCNILHAYANKALHIRTHANAPQRASWVRAWKHTASTAKGTQHNVLTSIHSWSIAWREVFIWGVKMLWSHDSCMLFTSCFHSCVEMGNKGKKECQDVADSHRH